MKKWLAMLLVAALAWGNVALADAEELEIADDIIVEAVEDDALAIEIESLPEAIDLPDLQIPIEEDVELDLNLSAAEDFNIDEDGVLVDYDGPGGDVVIPDGVTSIGRRAFWKCSSLTSVTIPDSVTSIGEEAFSFCASLTSVTIPDSVTSIGTWAFEYCGSLTSVVIPNSVTTIEEFAFTACSSLTSVTIPGSVTTIGCCAFSRCSSLTSVTIPNTVIKIGDEAFDACSSLTSVTIPSSVTNIGYAAFKDCPNLTIYGEEGSYAQTYAAENNIPFVAGTPAPPSEPLTLNYQGRVSMLPKKTLQLKATSVPAGVTAPLKWKSTAPKVAKVNAKGKVTALKKGKAIIYATAGDGQSAAVEIWVSQVPAMAAPTVKRKSDTAVTVSWTPLNGVNGYEIAVGKNKNATSAVNVSGGSKKKATVYVTPGQKLFYRVRGYMNNGTKKIYGAWSNAKALTLKRKAETYQEFDGKAFTGSNSVGDVKYTVALLDWKHEGRTTTIKTKVTFEWKKMPNSYGLDALAMGVSGDFTNDSVQGTLEYAPWNQSGAADKKSGGFLTVKPKAERSGKGDGVYFKITPSKVYDTYYVTTTVRGAKKKIKKYRYTYATTGSIIATWSVDSAEPVTNFSIFASYGDNQQKIKVDPSVNFSNGSIKFSVTAKLESQFVEGPLAYAKVKIKTQ